MPRSSRPAAPAHPRRLATLTGCLIVAATLAAVAVMAFTAEAQTATSVVCPPEDRAQPAATAVRPGARKTLVPHGATALIVCRYNGMNALGGAPQWGLRGAGASDDPRQVRRIAAALDALRPTHGVRSCPMDDGSAVNATFAYGSPPGVTVTIDTGGCNVISNGHVRRLGLGSPVIAAVTALAKPVGGLRWASVRGHLRLCGGPAPGRCRIEDYNGPDRVTVTSANGLWLAMANVIQGRFAFRIAGSGTYTFGLYAGNAPVKKLRARVTAGRTTRIVFVLPIP
jgi:hypothetical protein